MKKTISRIMFGSRNEEERKLLMKWCDLAAENGGSFSIEELWQTGQWYQIYTIYWPEGEEE